jgi:hypothetical protein
MAKKPALQQISDGGPRLVDLDITSSSLVLMVHHPGMNIGKFRILTSLDVEDGATAEAFRDLCDRLIAKVHCGLTGTRESVIDVVRSPAGLSLEFDCGEPGMYSNEVTLSTVGGESFRDAIKATLGKSTTESFLTMLIVEDGPGHDHGHVGHDPGGHVHPAPVPPQPQPHHH